jgi:pre-mRNA-processing factor 19
LDIHPYYNDFIISGGVDSKAVLFNIKEGKMIKDIKKHNKKITAIQFLPNESLLAFATCSADNSGGLFIIEGEGADTSIVQKYRVQCHSNALTSVSFHPLNEYALFSSMDGHWSFHNLLRVNNNINI